MISLVIAGNVEKFVTINPPNVNLSGVVGDPIKKTVTIVPEEKYPFKITNVHAKNGKFIKFQLDNSSRTGKPEYTLTVENLKEDVGRYFDFIILDTDSKIQPNLNVRVFGNLRPRPVKE